MTSWKVICTQSRYEFKVEEQLERLGIVNYLPKIKLLRQWSDRKKIIIAPAFPGYIFVNNDENLRNQVFSAKGVLQYVRIENRDAIIREKEMQLIHLVETAFSSTAFQIGNLVQIKHGPFQGYQGLLKRVIKKEKATLVLKDISLGFVLELPLNDLVLI